MVKMKTGRTRITVFISAKITSDLYAKKPLGLKQVQRISSLTTEVIYHVLYSYELNSYRL